MVIKNATYVNNLYILIYYIIFKITHNYDKFYNVVNAFSNLIEISTSL